MSIRVATVYGRDKVHSTPYLTRVSLTRRLSLHIFHRGDRDPDPHDHDQAFITFPLTPYIEHVYDPATGEERYQVVRAWRVHYRPAAYAHRVVDRSHASLGGGGDGIVTLVLWVGRKGVREWGFWTRAGEADLEGQARRTFVPWKTYIFGELP